MSRVRSGGDDKGRPSRQKDSSLLSSRDIAALNRARDVLKRLEDAAFRRSLGQHDPSAAVAGWDLGRLSEAATAADDAIFHVLSTARTYCGVKITDAQLVGRAAATQRTERVAHHTDAAQSTDVINGCMPEQIADARAASSESPRDLRAAGG
jgi:hypothetical protein